MKTVQKLAAALATLACLAGCPDQIAEGKDMMRGASAQEKANVEKGAHTAGAQE